ncbi:DUF1190 domain-containing protein [Roseomonas populi]|uniref:DUF1190 domain-containing protein n=1 Tax=Roseomonas populi TaxID=3121582 RepID=A0ABT1X8H0_9PROT|nr:DUF1190 domain-containing protein [Roseomonas pecuniae]MCR0984405.1 DUF1190 domain-containing protein [Roseomonas pecuniae]
MRRSSKIALTLVAGAGIGAWAVGAFSGDRDEEGVLTSEAACVERLGSDAGPECGDVFRDAAAEHARTAPRYASEQECREATGGECTGVGASKSAGATAASLFIPAMAGVMVGRLLADGTRGAMPVYAGAAPPPGACPPGATQPGCPPSNGSSRGSSGGGGGSGGRAYWYSGTSYAGTSEGAGRNGFRAASATAEGGTMLARSAEAASGRSSSYSSGRSASRSGGLGFSASAHSGSAS